MADELIKVRIEGEIAYVALNRPEKRNAISTAVLREIPDALRKADQPGVRAIILYGEGQVFSAGIDFTSLAGDVGGSGGSSGPANCGKMGTQPARWATG